MLLGIRILFSEFEGNFTLIWRGMTDRVSKIRQKGVFKDG